MVAPIVLQVCAVLAGSALVMQQYVKPRLPVYKLKLLRGGFPSIIKWSDYNSYNNNYYNNDSDSGNDNYYYYRTVMPTGVEFFNANYLHLDVYALSFDLLAATTDSTMLHHIGNIQDEYQNANNNQTNHEPIWSIKPRSNFTTHTSLYLSTHLKPMLSSLSYIMKLFYKTSGHLSLPTTGVAHIKASTEIISSSTSTKKKSNNNKKSLSKIISTALPFTVSIICDNYVDIIHMEVTGVECILHNMIPGFINMTTATTSLRQYAIDKLRVNDTGGILQHPSSATFTEIMNTIAWEESMQMLS